MSIFVKEPTLWADASSNHHPCPSGKKQILKNDDVEKKNASKPVRTFSSQIKKRKCSWWRAQTILIAFSKNKEYARLWGPRPKTSGAEAVFQGAFEKNNSFPAKSNRKKSWWKE